MAEKIKIDRPQWDEYFMLQALLASTRSSCCYFKTGAVIVKDNRIIASGYNGAPKDVENCLERGCRKDECGIDFDDKGKGVCRGIHAEINALNQVSRWDLKDGKVSMYTLNFPCSGCAKQLIGSGIKRVIYAKCYHEPDSLTEEIFRDVGALMLRDVNEPGYKAGEISKSAGLYKLDMDVDKYLEEMKKLWKV